MTTDDCSEIAFMLQADCDGELDIAGTALVAAHIARCPACAALQKDITDLSARLRTELPYHAAPARLRQAIEAALPRPAAASAPRRAGVRQWLQLGGHWFHQALPVGGGLALAASLAVVLLLPRGNSLSDDVVASHIRALQPGHLMDVVSTDQHTVKPWFDGRLDYAPPVKDLAAQGFPLIGGRLDYLAGRPVAALAYNSAKHVIDLYVWPSSSHLEAPPGAGDSSGYNYLRWTQDEMVFWVVSDLNKPELTKFVDRWRAMP